MHFTCTKYTLRLWQKVWKSSLTYIQNEGVTNKKVALFFIIQFYQPMREYSPAYLPNTVNNLNEIKKKTDCDMDRSRSTIYHTKRNTLSTHDPQLSSSFNFNEIKPDKIWKLISHLNISNSSFFSLTYFYTRYFQTRKKISSSEFNFNEIKS